MADVKLNGKTYTGVKEVNLPLADDSGKATFIIPAFQSKSVTPGKARQTITHDEGYDGLSEVVVAGDDNLIADNIKLGVEVFGVTGACKTDPVLQKKSVTPGTDEQSISADSGYDGLSAVVVAGDADLLPENIRSGVEVFGVTGTLEETPSAEGVLF